MTDRRRAARTPIAPPAHLTGAAAEIWTVLVAELAAEGWLVRSVLPLIERYAVAFARWRRAEAELATEGAVVPAPRSKVPMQNPWLPVARNAANEMARLERELRLSPARRSFPPHPLNSDGSPRRSNDVMASDDD